MLPLEIVRRGLAPGAVDLLQAFAMRGMRP
jgi:hypothetical protein